MSNDIAQQPVLVIMGVSGCGKSTVAGILAGRLGWDLEEGDDLHPARNITKMAAGDPLTDDARRPWLDRVAGWIRAHTTAGIPGIIHLLGPQTRLPRPTPRRPRRLRTPDRFARHHRAAARRPHRPLHAHRSPQLTDRQPGASR